MRRSRINVENYLVDASMTEEQYHAYLSRAHLDDVEHGLDEIDFSRRPEVDITRYLPKDIELS